MYLSVCIFIPPSLPPSTYPFIYLQTKFRAVLTEWEKVPQATIYEDRKQTLIQLVGTKLTHVVTILPLPPAPNGILNTMYRLMGRHWNYVKWMSRYASPPCGFSFLKYFISNTDRLHGTSKPGTSEHEHRSFTHRICFYQNWSLHDSKQCHHFMPTPFQPGKAWHPPLIPTFNLRRTPIWNSTLLTPHNTGHTLISDEACNSLHCFYVGDVRMEDGHWQHKQDVNKHCCTITNIRRQISKWQTLFPPLLPKSTTSSPLLLPSKN
jgi:hypothetical protein